jgi:putative intracellular protease/amidase
MPKVLIVTTSHRQLGETGKPTGVWLEELAAPYYALLDGGAEVTIASIAGGPVPVDPRSAKRDGTDAEPTRRFLADSRAMAAIESTPSIAQLDPANYDAIFLPGGHGTMWDLPDSTALSAALGRAFDDGRIVAAVCHGPAGLVPARTAGGKPIVEGRRVSAFTDEEEEAAGLTKVVPFLLESKLRDLGARFEKGPPFQSFAVRDGNLITGQNPPSSAAVAHLVLEALSGKPG